VGSLFLEETQIWIECDILTPWFGRLLSYCRLVRPKAHVFWGAPFDFFLMGCSHTLWFAWNFGDEMGFAFIVYKLSTRQGSTRKHDRKGDSTTLWWEAFLIEPGKCWSWDDFKENLWGNLFLWSEMAVSYIFPEINPVISSTNRWWSPENTSAEICWQRWRCWQYLHGISAYDPLATWYTIWLFNH